MSYSKDVKQEIVKKRPRERDNRRAMLIGLTHACSSLILGRELRVEYTTEAYNVGKLIGSLASSLYDVEVMLALKETGRIRQTVVTLAGEATKTLLNDAGLLLISNDGMELGDKVPGWIVQGGATGRAFLKGMFLGAGSVANPEKGYHMEIVCKNEGSADAALSILSGFDCGAKMVRRNHNTVIYLKDGDKISMFLTLMGAPSSTLLFEQERTEKELRNYVNRTNNCETANIGKTVNASAEQIEAIRQIMLDPLARKRLSPKLLETAEARLNNPELSLIELGELCSIGKSGINHRLQRIMAVARELKS